VWRCGVSGLALNFAAPTAGGENVCFPVVGEYQKFTATSGDYFEMNYDSGRFCVESSTDAQVYGDFELTVSNGTGKSLKAVGSIPIDAVAEEINGKPGWRSRFVGDSWSHF